MNLEKLEEDKLSSKCKEKSKEDTNSKHDKEKLKKILRIRKYL